MCCIFSQYTLCQILWKFVNICRHYSKMNRGLFFWLMLYCMSEMSEVHVAMLLTATVSLHIQSTVSYAFSHLPLIVEPSQKFCALPVSIPCLPKCIWPHNVWPINVHKLSQFWHNLFLKELAHKSQNGKNYLPRNNCNSNFSQILENMWHL